MEYIEINKYSLIGFLNKRQVKVAKAIGMHPDTLSKKLAEPETFTIKELNAIGMQFDAPLRDLLTFQRAVTEPCLDEDEDAKKIREELRTSKTG